MMKKWWTVLIVLVPLALAFAYPDASEELIKLDKKWGEANLKGDKAFVGKLLADDLMGIAPQGMTSKSQILGGMEPTGETTYNAGDFKVKMLGENTAVMTHSVKVEDQTYGSLHVWVKQDGMWTVVATANVPFQSPSTDNE
jgi:hypothetical protein